MSNAPNAQGKLPAPPPDETRLESWGEIAAYLRRDVRTVQRWEKEQGLPVRRLLIGKSGQVYAFRSELDKWMRERQPKADGDGPAAPPVDAHPEETNILRSPWLWIGGILIIASMVAVAWIFPPPTKQDGRNLGGASKALLFVRPFKNLSSDPQQNVFVTGLKDEIITDLGKLNDDRLGVFAPTTSDEWGNEPIESLVAKLHANYVLEGSVRRVTDQLRVNVDLVAAGDQTPVWANSYTGNVQDVLQVQDQISGDVVKQIRVKFPGLGSEQHERTASAAQVNFDVYEPYVTGRVYWRERDVQRSLTYYKAALQKDPNYAPALAGLASAYLLLGEIPNDALPPAVAIPQARSAAQRALAIDGTLADAYAVQANIAMSYDHDLAEAKRLFEKAIEVDPNNVTAREWYGYYLMVTHQMREAEAQIAKALEIDPGSALLNSTSAELKYYERNYDGSIEQANKTLKEHPGFRYALLWLAWSCREKKMYPQALQILEQATQQSGQKPAYLAQYGHALAVAGKTNEARQVLAQLRGMSHSQYVPAIYVAGIYVGLGDRDMAFQWLDAAYKEHDDRLIYLDADPIADTLRPDPRFRALMKKAGLP